MKRIRQIVIAAPDLEAARAEVEAKLGLTPCYRDPNVAHFGLENVMFAIGDQFLEIVTPRQEGTAAGRHLERNGPSPYMLILQTDDLPADRARIAGHEVREVWKSERPDISAVHFHPADMGATILSLDEPVDPASWPWAGPEWCPPQERGRAAVLQAGFAAKKPSEFAAAWAVRLGLEAPVKRGGVNVLQLNESELVFHQADADRLSSFGLKLPNFEPCSLEVAGTVFDIVPA